MSLTSRLSSRLQTQLYNRGTFYVKYLVCLQEFDTSQTHEDPQAQQITNFRETHGLSVDEFIEISDILGGQIDTVQQLSGPAFSEYEQHLDYKLRNIGLSSGDDIVQTWNELNENYSDIHEVLTPSQRRVEVLKQLSKIFIKRGKTSSDLSTINQEDVQSILSNLGTYQRLVIAELEGDQEIEAYEHVFDNIRAQLQENPVVFMVDVVAYIDGALRNAGLPAIVQIEPVGQVAETQEASVASIAPENAQAFLTELNAQIGAPLRRYVEDEDGRTLLIDNEANMPVVSPLPRFVFGGAASVFAYTALMGTAPISVLLGFPLVGYYAFQKLQKYESANVRAVSHVYLREEGNAQVLDFVLQENQETVEVIENIETSEVQMTTSPDAEVTYGGKTVTLAEARAQGLSPMYEVISIQGNNFFIPSCYSTNQDLLAQSGIQA